MIRGVILKHNQYSENALTFYITVILIDNVSLSSIDVTQVPCGLQAPVIRQSVFS